MGKSYSIDLRERAVAAVLEGGVSRHKAAAQFDVGASATVNRVRRFQDTGSVAPVQMGDTSRRRSRRPSGFPAGQLGHIDLHLICQIRDISNTRSVRRPSPDGPKKGEPCQGSDL